MNRWTHIILHHSLTDDGIAVNWQAVRNWHMGLHPESPYQGDKAMQDIGYHFGIEWIHRGYEILMGRPLDMDGGHTIGMNKKAVGILCMGNYDVQYPRPLMLDRLVPLLRVLCKIFKIPVENIKGHRDYADKSCPGKNFDLNIIRGMLDGG